MKAEEVSWALRDFTRAAVDVDYVLARRIGLRPMDYTALNHVFTADGDIGPHELSDRLGISTGSTSELVDRLERSGHVERRRSDEDRRRVGLQPTTHAVEEVLSELAPIFSALDTLAEDYTPTERSLVCDFLRRAAQVMRDYQPD